MRKLGLATVFFILVFVSSARALNLNGKVGFGVKTYSFIPMGSFKIFFSDKDSLEIEGGAGSNGWAVGAQYMNHFAKIGSLATYFCAGGGAVGPIGGAGFGFGSGIGAEYFTNKDWGIFVTDRISVQIYPNAIVFIADIEAGFHYYFP